LAGEKFSNSLTGPIAPVSWLGMRTDAQMNRKNCHQGYATRTAHKHCPWYYFHHYIHADVHWEPL